MPLATLQFNLPEERVEYEITMRAVDFSSILWEVDQKLRAWLKHGHEFTDPESVMEELRKMIHEELDERGARAAWES